MRLRIYALLGVMIFIGLIYLYTREFIWFSNTIGIQKLLMGAFVVGGALISGLLYYYRDRFSPISRHYPEVLFIGIMSLLFMPLFASLLNRLPGKKVLSEFVFVSERPIVATGYGLLENETIKPTAWILTVSDQGVIRKFKYQKQAYYPITQPGELISLPVVHGLLGIWVVDME